MCDEEVVYKPSFCYDENGLIKKEKRQKAEKNIKFWSLPEVLVITLKRFSNNNRKNQGSRKINTALIEKINSLNESY